MFHILDQCYLTEGDWTIQLAADMFVDFVPFALSGLSWALYNIMDSPPSPDPLNDVVKIGAAWLGLAVVPGVVWTSELYHPSVIALPIPKGVASRASPVAKFWP